jgi:ABC-type uncharacterized transport system fused permease/ATPase subunit
MMGVARKLAFARIVLQDPDIIVLDEATAVRAAGACSALEP